MLQGEFLATLLISLELCVVGFDGGLEVASSLALSAESRASLLFTSPPLEERNQLSLVPQSTSADVYWHWQAVL